MSVRVYLRPSGRSLTPVSPSARLRSKEGCPGEHQSNAHVLRIVYMSTYLGIQYTERSRNGLVVVDRDEEQREERETFRFLAQKHYFKVTCS